MYVNDPQPLDEGEEKHVISAFVADESGMINRVAGVFARRGKQRHMHSCQEPRADMREILWRPIDSTKLRYSQEMSIETTHAVHAGANIESLAVGLNIDKALFTISITGRPSTVVRATPLLLMSVLTDLANGQFMTRGHPIAKRLSTACAVAWWTCTHLTVNLSAGEPGEAAAEAGQGTICGRHHRC